ncbi:AGAP009239-PA-like protein [Anopheles sinensis]|uniref:RanBP-type and C3HC4-type zinc finger-containing protein 1 n=1 Tax=Anopheles sinensis TaxID=74873 RepID=A0A084VMC3_ANOSI|nr:AGAP009239-PA-like protein [Anopheles sinensis]
MNSQSDGGAKVLVNAYAGSKGAAGGKKKSSIAQSKNAPDSRSSATGSNGRTGAAGLSRSTSATSTSGGFQSFFRWFRRDDSRVLARSTSGAEVTPELHDRSARQRQQQQPNPQRPQRPTAAVQQQHDAGVGDSFSSGSIGASEESSLVAGGGTIVSRRTIDSTTSSKSSVPTGDGVSQSAASNGTHSSSPSPSPVIDCNNLSKSSSCDSILSTATNGFAFVPPNCYEAVLASGKPESRRTIQPGPYTDSYKRRCWQRDRSREIDRKYELTLRKKYRLFASLRESPSKEQRQNSDTTLTRDNQHTVYSDLSLPATSNDIRSDATNEETQGNGVDPSVIRRHRRTVSDSSKDRRAGAYVHVKGKRRAPPPPPLDPGTSGSSSNGTLTRRSNYYGTLSPGSTLSTRKKRPAPAPPVSPTTPYLNESSSSTSLLEDKEIKAIIEGRPLPLLTPKQQSAHESETLIMPLPLLRPLSPLPNISEERAPPGGLTEEQKQQLIDNIRKVQSQTTQPAPETPPTHVDDTCDVMKMEEQFSRANGTRSPIHDYLYAEAMASAKSSSSPQPSSHQAVAAPTSPISPRPWYKRPISGIRQQESSLPFKRDIILKTIDKRKSGSGGSGKHAKETGEDLPEVGYCRNSMLQEGSSSGTGGGSPPSSSGAKFNLFAKITEKSDDTKRRERDAEKRRSAIGIPSISELDREAAEIVHNEYRCNGGTEKDTPSGKQKTTKELISKFEATSVPVVGKVITVNSSFVARKDYFGGDPVAHKSVSPVIKSPANPQPVVSAGTSSDDPPSADVTSNVVKPPAPGPSTGGPSSASTPPETTSSSLSKTGSDKNLLGLWNCPYCTLENPNWRIICEACERIKPYDSKLSILEEPPLRPNHPLKRPIPDARKLQPTNPPPPATQGSGVDDWDKKTERVLKYFMPKPLAAPATNGTLLVGTNGGDDRASLMQRKPTYGQTKPLASPKMGVKSLMKRVPGDSPMPAPYRNFNAVPERYGTALDNGAGCSNSSNKFDDQKLKESHSNHTTVAAPLASPEPTAEKEDTLYAVVNKTSAPTAVEQVNIEEIRSARIARFGVIAMEPPTDHQPEVKCNETEPSATAKSKEQQDQEALEKEKERLREMIRVMNAKALAEKYPVVQKPPTSNHSSLKRDSPLVQRKNGLTSGIPVSTKSLSPLPARKGGSSNPLGTRKSPAPLAPEDHGVKNDATVSVVAVIEPVASPHTGAIRKTFFPRRTSSETGVESKIINQDGVAIPETVAELNQQQSGPSLVLTNDVQGIHYEPMDEQQFARATVGAPLRQGEPISSIPRPSNVPLSPRLQDRHRKSLLEKQQQHDEKVKQISDQLRSQQGVDRFRNTLLYTSNSNFGRTGTLAINKLLRNLEQAISDGAHDRAAELATDLAKMKVSLSVTRQSPGRSTCSTSSGSLTDISLNVYVDDKVSHKGPLSVSLAAFGTLGQLKQKFCNEYQIPVAVQRWRCDDRPLDDDTKTLFDYGIQTNDRTLHVFLVQPIAAPARDRTKPQAQLQVPGFTKVEAKLLTVSSESEGEHSDTQNDDTMLGAAALPIAAPRRTSNAKVEEIAATEEEGWACPMCTLINPQKRPGCAACSEARPNIVHKQAQVEVMPPQDSITVTPEDLKRFLDEQPPLAPGRRNGTSRELTSGRTEVALRNPPLETRNDLNRISSNRKSSDIFNILLDESKASGAAGGAVEVPVPKPRTSDLVRPVHMQIPEQNRIVMTAAFQAHRSPNITRSQYRGVDNFNPNSSGLSKPERPIITTASPIVRAVLLKSSTATAGVDKPGAVRFGRNGLALPEDGTEVAPNHYTELVNLDNADLIANIEPFECPICFGPFQPYEGIVLRDCLHSFCKQCLISTIQYSEDAAIRCPYSDAVYSCESVIQQREIKALVSKELYEAHLAKSIQQAESAIDNTFHCRTPNCRGWCIYEDNVNQFKCPVCRIVNCLTCRVIHDGLDCKQYQDRMNSDCDTNLEARRTKAMLQDMIEKGDALNCPTCQVIVMKKWGCDWLKCSMCKTEICWVTRGHRWGPAGKGDTSGGCRCGVNGIKCHPKCNYCH